MPPPYADDSALAIDLRAGLIGRYDVDRVIGRGGMSTVFLARDIRHGRPHPVLGNLSGLDGYSRRQSTDQKRAPGASLN